MKTKVKCEIIFDCDMLSFIKFGSFVIENISQLESICNSMFVERNLTLIIIQRGVNLYIKFKELLDKTNKTTYQVSEETGISQIEFSNWKSGRSEPSIDSLKKLSQYFGVNIEYFLDYDKTVNIV